MLWSSLRAEVQHPPVTGETQEGSETGRTFNVYISANYGQI